MDAEPLQGPHPEERLPSPGLALEVLSGEDAFPRLESEWRGLERRAPAGGVFQSFAWNRGLWQIDRGRRTTLRILAARQGGGGLVAVLPLVLERRPGLRVLRFLGHPLSDLQDLLLAKGTDAQAVVALFDSWLESSEEEYDLIDLDELPADSPLLRYDELESGQTAAQRSRVQPSSVCRFVPLPADFDAYLASLSKNFRKNLRRRRELLEQRFEVRFEVEDGRGDAQAAIGDLMALHQARMRATGQRGFSRAAARRQGFGELFRALLEEGSLRINRLCLDGRTVAADAVLSDRSVATFYVGGLDPDPDLRRYSLGSLNLLEGIRRAIETGHRECDLARGDEPYKQQFLAEVRQNQRWFAARSPLRARVYTWRKLLWQRLSASSALRSAYRRVVVGRRWSASE